MSRPLRRGYTHRDSTDRVAIDNRAISPNTWEGLRSLIESFAITVLILAAAYGMSYWANRAQHDRAAYIGLLLVFGFPSVLLVVAGAAVALTGSRDGATFLGIGLGLGLPLLRQVRVFFARFTHIDPDSRIDMVGLAVMLPIMVGLGVVAFTTPEPNEQIESVNLGELLVQVIMFAGLAVILVGAGIYRNRQQVIERLALRKLTPRAAGIALAAVIVVLFISGMASLVTDWLQPDLYDDLQQVTRDMTADVQNPIGAIALGLSAGIGEELLMRGAIQPRFGIFMTSLFFAILHTQYGLTFVLVGLFLIGMLLGKLRDRYGTAAPIITHAVFNAIVVLAQSAN